MGGLRHGLARVTCAVFAGIGLLVTIIVAAAALIWWLDRP